MTEQKIREAYERVTTDSGMQQTVHGYVMFNAGYLAMLNDLTPAGIITETAVMHDGTPIFNGDGKGKAGDVIFTLPEGVEKP